VNTSVVWPNLEKLQ